MRITGSRQPGPRKFSDLRNSDQSLPRVHPGLGHRQAGCGASKHRYGRYDQREARGDRESSEALLKGEYYDQFTVDWYQGGAGTSTNMNANEVLANVALELTGHSKGDYKVVEPHDDLNMSQSTNDSYPTALKVAFILRNDKLIAELEKLSASFRAKGDAYMKVLKMGRTEMQDAVP